MLAVLDDVTTRSAPGPTIPPRARYRARTTVTPSTPPDACAASHGYRP